MLANVRGGGRTPTASLFYALGMAIVVLLVGYHLWCGRVLSKFARNESTPGHVWFRWFNEAPVLMLLAAVILVVVKPF